MMSAKGVRNWPVAGLEKQRRIRPYPSEHKGDPLDPKSPFFAVADAEMGLWAAASLANVEVARDPDPADVHVVFEAGDGRAGMDL